MTLLLLHQLQIVKLTPLLSWKPLLFSSFLCGLFHHCAPSCLVLKIMVILDDSLLSTFNELSNVISSAFNTVLMLNIPCSFLFQVSRLYLHLG